MRTRGISCDFGAFHSGRLSLCLGYQPQRCATKGLQKIVHFISILRDRYEYNNNNVLIVQRVAHTITQNPPNLKFKK